MGVNECIVPKCLPVISEHLTVVYLQVYGGWHVYILSSMPSNATPRDAPLGISGVFPTVTVSNYQPGSKISVTE